MKARTRLVSTAVASFAALTLGSCAPDASSAQSDSLVVREQWVKAAGSGATAAFAELQNTGDDDVRIVGASSPAAGHVELHEVADDGSGTPVMREKDGGFVVPAGETHLLAPGADHVMLMDVTSVSSPGVDVELTLEFEDGSRVTFTAQARDFAGAQEHYAPAASTPSHGG
ncbi:copper chaperone PCu(A)C [Rhodococcus sp. HNM0569]|uniref:copper chaperone PCu(A)C n=1 Tax=Rhodococcus sp. HNM0569 TaxID=2716340 RepID=UPI00146B1EC1|nr:copper chaperone PCu(A)C [Rhodococcus sp. HNM0569]NLU83588.1 copper chaperone PCu(A)C [Rhodococcus sp. HNM0569]